MLGGTADWCFFTIMNLKASWKLEGAVAASWHGPLAGRRMSCRSTQLAPPNLLSPPARSRKCLTHQQCLNPGTPSAHVLRKNGNRRQTPGDPEDEACDRQSKIPHHATANEQDPQDTDRNISLLPFVRQMTHFLQRLLRISQLCACQEMTRKSARRSAMSFLEIKTTAFVLRSGEVLTQLTNRPRKNTPGTARVILKVSIFSRRAPSATPRSQHHGEAQVRALPPCTTEPCA